MKKKLIALGLACSLPLSSCNFNYCWAAELSNVHANNNLKVDSSISEKDFQQLKEVISNLDEGQIQQLQEVIYQIQDAKSQIQANLFEKSIEFSKKMGSILWTCLKMIFKVPTHAVRGIFYWITEFFLAYINSIGL